MSVCCSKCGKTHDPEEMVIDEDRTVWCVSCTMGAKDDTLVGVEMFANQSRLTPKSGDRLTRRQRELLSEIASIDEGIGYELSYLIEPNWWMDLYLDDQWDGPFPQIIADLAFPMEPEDPMNICWDEWEQNRGRLSETPEEEWKRLELEAIHKEIRDSNCD